MGLSLSELVYYGFRERLRFFLSALAAVPLACVELVPNDVAHFIP